MNISVGNRFTLSKVMASDRGVYTAKISNPFAGSANVTYTLLVNCEYMNNYYLLLHPSIVLCIAFIVVATSTAVI